MNKRGVLIDINVSETVVTVKDFVTPMEIQDAQNIAKSRVHAHRAFGWVQFSFDELLAEAYAGISEAILRFNPCRGTVQNTKFTSYAYFWIDKRIKEHIARNKSMLTGNLKACWDGVIPYVNSYDAFAETEDSAGLDSMICLSEHDNSYEENIEREDRTNKCKELFSTLMESLTPQEALCFQLLNGIGTITGDPMTVRQIARSAEISVGTVSALLSSAKTKLDEYKELHTEQFNSIFK